MTTQTKQSTTKQSKTKPSKTYRRQRLLAIVAVMVVVLTTGWAAAAEVIHDHSTHDHGDHDHASSLGHDSRFTAPGGVWPPQPKGATEVVVHDAGILASQAPAARLQALDTAEPEVAAALGDRSNLIATWDDDGDPVLLYYSLSNNESVEVTVSDSGAPTIDRRAPTEWQPPLSEDEKVIAADIARGYWEAEGNARVDALDGYSILAFTPDGSYYDTRMVYVSFHQAADARPELINWVDLVAGEVVQAEVEDLTGLSSPDDSTSPSGNGATTFQREATPFADAAAPGPNSNLVISGDSVSFAGWVFQASVEPGVFDGVSLRDVSYNDVSVFQRVSLPAMNVYYDELCGPYVDRIGGAFYDTEAPTEFTLDGVRWLQLGITDYIGNYVITQMYYFSEDGHFDYHMFSKGLQCNIRHDHLPFLRFDTELGAPGGDVIHRALADGNSEAMTTEFSLRATEAFEHGWEVRDTESGYTLTVNFDDNNPGLGTETVVPITDYQNNFVYGRQSMPGEQSWQGGPTLDFYGDDGQTISDAVLVYRGFMPHTPEEGPDLWHSTGIRTAVVAPSTTPDTASIAGTVTNTEGNPEAGFKIDLFSELRAEFLSETQTATDGTFSFDVEPGCYVLTFVAPDDGSTLVGSGRFLNRPACVSSGQTLSGTDAVLIGPSGGSSTAVGGNVRLDEGSPAVNLNAGLFTVGRAEFLGLARTDSNGDYRFELASAMCGVVTLVAPVDFVFQETRTQFQNLDFCASAGQQVLNLDAVVLTPDFSAEVGGQVADEAGPVAGVRAVLYEADSEGSRARFLGLASTDDSGLWAIDVAPGCYVVDLVAPASRTWMSNGGRYLQSSACVQSGDSNDSFGGSLSR